MQKGRTASIRSFVGAGLLSLGLGFGLARCGADNVNAPPPPADTSSPDKQCKSAEEAMPEFFKLLNDPAQPLKGIRDVVTALANGAPAQVQGNPLAPVLADALHGLVHFAKDPKENGDSCVVVSAAVAPPSAPLCTLTPAAPCESRICALRRALEFGLHDSGGSKAFNDLQPLLAKVVGYLTNMGPGAEGQTHYELIDVFNRTSRDEARCSPANLLDVLDGIVVYFRANRTCGANCVGLQALQTIQDLIEDPALQSFLQNYADANQDGKGRASFQALGQVLGNAFANMPEDEHYFDNIQTIVDKLVAFFDNDSTHQYDQLKQKVLAVTAIAKDFLNPMRPNAISKQLKAVTACVTVVDKNQEIVGALYDLLSRPGGMSGNGLDLKELVVSLNSLAKLDQDGVLMGALHAVLASLRADDQSMSDVRLFLVDFLTVDNAQKLLPSVQVMIANGVITETLTYLDSLLYGCQPVGQP